MQFGVHAALSRRRPRVQIPSGPRSTQGSDQGRVAQSAEHTPEKRGVTGSTPVPATRKQAPPMRNAAPLERRLLVLDAVGTARAQGCWSVCSTCSRNCRISLSRKRRWPPSVRIAEIFPARAHLVTVLGLYVEHGRDLRRSEKGIVVTRLHVVLHLQFHTRRAPALWDCLDERLAGASQYRPPTAFTSPCSPPPFLRIRDLVSRWWADALPRTLCAFCLRTY